MTEEQNEAVSEFADPQDFETVRWAIKGYALQCDASSVGTLQVLEMTHSAQTNHVAINGACDSIDLFALESTNMNPEEFPPQKRGFMMYRTGDEMQHPQMGARFVLSVLAPLGNRMGWLHIFEVPVDQETGEIAISVR